MKKIHSILQVLLVAAALSIMPSGCKEDLMENPQPQSFNIAGYGDVMFWAKSDLLDGEKITVTCNAVSRAVNVIPYTGNMPECGAPTAAVYNLTSGEHSFIAQSASGKYWVGRFTLDAGTCKKIELRPDGSIQ